ncbi:MAG: hypothetical protein RMJ66_02605 [Bacteroidia bacterium]|nr:hypothetical protein [Bacteroidia bacterium]
MLHAAETVEILSLDEEGGWAWVSRAGFSQRLPLRELVIEEEEQKLLCPSPFSHLGQEEIELYLVSYPSQNRADLLLYHGLSHSCFYSLYLQAGKRLWHPLLNRLLSQGEEVKLSLSLKENPPPWQLRLLRVVAPAGPVQYPPQPFTIQFELRYVHFIRQEKQRIPLHLSSVKSSLDSSPEKIGEEASNLFSKLPREIDLHIEKLSTSMADAPPEAIFDYQVATMQRYLIACEAANYPSVVVIHGVGRKRLQASLVEFCHLKGWQVEPLLLPPYKGGAR